MKILKKLKYKNRTITIKETADSVHAFVGRKMVTGFGCGSVRDAVSIAKNYVNNPENYEE